jgi:hypothetical protein
MRQPHGTDVLIGKNANQPSFDPDLGVKLILCFGDEKGTNRRIANGSAGTD